MSIIVEFLANAQVWVIFGISLFLVELVAGGMFALPVGVAAMGMAALLFVDGFSEPRVLTGWEEILVVFAIFTVLSTGILRRVLQKKHEVDINKY